MIDFTSRTQHFFNESGVDPGEFLKRFDLIEFDRISVITLRIQSDRPEQTV